MIVKCRGTGNTQPRGGPSLMSFFWLIVSTPAVECLLGTLALLPLEVRCDAGVRFLHGFITEDSTAPCGCLSDSSLFLSATWMGLEVAGLHAGRSPGVCVFHLHSEGGALLLGALEIALFIQGVT